MRIIVSTVVLMGILIGSPLAIGEPTFISPQSRIEGSGISNGGLVLRSSPPSGLFYRKGATLGFIEPGTRLSIIGRKNVTTLFGSQEWLKVQPYNQLKPDNGPEANPQKPDKEGWIFNGEEEEIFNRKGGWIFNGEIKDGTTFKSYVTTI